MDKLHRRKCSRRSPGCEACVYVLHAKWDERPLLLIVKVAGKDPAKEDISFLEDRLLNGGYPMILYS